MKTYFENNKKYYMAILLILIFLGIAIVAYYIVGFKKGFNLDSESEFIYKNNYKMEINYPVFNNKKVNDEIENTILEEKEKFFDVVDKDDNYENELNINYSYSIKDSIYSVHFRTYSYTGKYVNYYRNDKVYYFDKNNNKELTIDDLIKEKEFYNVIKVEIVKYLNEQKNYALYDSTKLEKELSNQKNYELLIFSDDKVYVILTPHTVSPYDGEINIGIDYSIVKDYLNKNYFTSLKNNEKKVNKDEDKDKDVKKEFVRIRDYKQFENKKIVAITFDDGPAYGKTETLLTEFEKRDVRATFFLLGELASKQPELVKRTYDMGHTIGSHTYDHKNLKKLDEEQLVYEIDTTNNILKNIIGEDIKFIRPPYGAYNEKILNNVNMSFILWSVDTEDWKLRDADKIAQFMVENIGDGDIVLLHDIHAETIDGVIKGIDLLKEQGYEFVSLDELVAYRKVVLENNKAYRHFRIEVPKENVEVEQVPIEEIVGTMNIDDPLSEDNKKN